VFSREPDDDIRYPGPAQDLGATNVVSPASPASAVPCAPYVARGLAGVVFGIAADREHSRQRSETNAPPAFGIRRRGPACWRRSLAAGRVVASCAVLKIGGLACQSASSTSPGIAGDITACTDFVDARCRRLAQCEVAEYSQCIETRSECPSYLFAAGSTTTPDAIHACIAEMADASCDNVLYHRCLPPGTRGAGEPCGFGSQCASYKCGGGDNKCGTCVGLAAQGGDCTTDKCPEGQACRANRCVPDDPDAGNGSSCNNVCPGRDLLCVSAQPSAASGTCLPPPRSGDPCVYLVSPQTGPTGGTPVAGCGAVGLAPADLWCRGSTDGGTGTCLARASEGEACGLVGGDFVNIVPCKDQFDCLRADGGRSTCQARQEAGAPCGLVGRQLVNCDLTLTCSSTGLDAGTCLPAPPAPAAGDSCGGDAGCGRLVCANGSCAMGVSADCL
jgi:hypothetical protein